MLSSLLGFVTCFGQDYPFDPLLPSVYLIRRRLHTTISTDLVGGFTKLVDMAINGRLPLVTVRRIASENAVITDNSALNLIQPDLVSKFSGAIGFAAFDDVSMGLEQADQFVLGRHAFLIENPSHCLINDLLGSVKEGV
jgi:hypothetical protein